MFYTMEDLLPYNKDFEMKLAFSKKGQGKANE